MRSGADGAVSGSMSLYIFARRVGVALPQVIKAARNGRLARSLATNAAGRPYIPDVALADKEWIENRDVRKIRTPGGTLAAARERLVAAQAERAELDNAKK